MCIGVFSKDEAASCARHHYIDRGTTMRMSDVYIQSTGTSLLQLGSLLSVWKSLRHVSNQVLISIYFPKFGPPLEGRRFGSSSPSHMTFLRYAAINRVRDIEPNSSITKKQPPKGYIWWHQSCVTHCSGSGILRLDIEASQKVSTSSLPQESSRLHRVYHRKVIPAYLQRRCFTSTASTGHVCCKQSGDKCGDRYR